MGPERFDDELLSAVLDGLADPETVASVEQDPDAAARLERMRMVQQLVATPVADATPERRHSSIAAALAAANSAPEVTSLTAARETKAATRRRWSASPAMLAAAAAFVIGVLAIPFIVGSDADTAETATDSASFEDAVADASDDAEASGAFDAAEAESFTDDDAMEDDAMEEDAMEEEAMDEMAESAAVEETASDDSGDAMEDADAAIDEMSARNADGLRFYGGFEIRRIDPAELSAPAESGEVVPVFFAEDLVGAQDVNLECLNGFPESEVPSFALVEDATVPLDVFPQRLLIVHWAIDGTLTALDAGDCTPVG